MCIEKRKALKAALVRLVQAGGKVYEIIALTKEDAAAMEETLQKEGLRHAGQCDDGDITVKQYTRGEQIVNLHCHCAN